MKKIVMFLIGMIIVTHNLTAITPSVYTGCGIGGANLGGFLGIGTEWQYKFLSLSTAVGYIPCVDDVSPVNYSLGIKLYYPKIGVFGGINYGWIFDVVGKEGCDFSFTVGYKHTFYKHIYGSCYLGGGSDKSIDYKQWIVSKGFSPQLGFIIGYTFRPVELKIDL